MAIALMLIAAAGCKLFRGKAEDEGPIIVKNGSMTVDTVDGQWNDDGDWSNDTTNAQHGGDLWVLVIYNDGSFCPASGNPATPAPAQGHPLHIEYSEPGFKPKFNVVGNNLPENEGIQKRPHASHNKL